MKIRHSKASLKHIEKTRDKAYEEWLESSQSKPYQKVRRDTFLRFLKFLEEQGFKNPTVDSILKQHKENRKSDDNKIKYQFDDLIPKFSQWLLDTRNITHNSAVNLAVPIKGFFRYHREPLKVQVSAITTIRKTRKKYHIFTQEELSRMVRVADIEEKAIILLGKDLGIRVGDFISIKKKPILEAYKNQKELPIEFEVETTKEGVIAIAHISQETWDALNDYWSNVPESEYVFPTVTKGKNHISTQRANDVLKNTWKRAFPDREDTRVRFHELRSFKMTALSNTGANQWVIKKLVGKKLSRDISTYLRGQNLKEAFKKAITKLRLIGTNGNNYNRITELEQTIVQIQKENMASKTALEVVTKRLIQIEEENKTLKTQIEITEHGLGDLNRMINDIDADYRLETIEKRLKIKRKFIREFT